MMTITIMSLMNSIIMTKIFNFYPKPQTVKPQESLTLTP